MNEVATVQAARLLGYALARPPMRATDPGYRELIDAYNDPHDRKVFEAARAIASGLGLQILDVNDFGVFLACTSSNSPFRPRLDNINKAFLDVDRRQLFGLALTTIAALMYQTYIQLAEESAPILSVQEARDKLVDIARARQEQIAQEEDADPSGIDEACAVISSLTVTATTPGGRIAQHTLHWAIDQAFSYLESERMVQKQSEEEGGTYIGFSKFRIHLQKFAATEAFQAVVAALEDASRTSEEAPHA